MTDSPAPIPATPPASIEEMLDEMEMAERDFAVAEMKGMDTDIQAQRCDAARSALLSEWERRTLTDLDIGFILSGEFGPRTCPCQHCVGLAQKLDRILKSTPRLSTGSVSPNPPKER